MSNLAFRIDASKEQFAWLAGQLKATRAVIRHCLDNPTFGKPVSIFGNTLPDLLTRTSGMSSALTSYVNGGMQGFSMSRLAGVEWQRQFQFRSINGKGIRQYDNGDLYIPPMTGSCRVICDGLDTVLNLPITAIIFKLDMTMPTLPIWWATLHINIRPQGPRPRKY